jgi:hypothetical protein
MGAVAQMNPLVGEIYARLGLVAADIAASQGLSADKVEIIRSVLNERR